MRNRIFSLKYFQVGTILCSKNDIFVNSALLGKPVDTMDFIELVDSFTRTSWFKEQSAEWGHNDVTFSEVLNYEGKCFNVNMEKNVYNIDV